MKLVLRLLSIGCLTFSAAGALADTIRCSGINDNRQVVGIDIVLDQANNKIVSVTSYEADSTYPYNLKTELFTPDFYLQKAANGGVSAFMFKAILQAGGQIDVEFAAGKPALTTLQLEYSTQKGTFLAKGDVECTVL